MRGTSIEQLGVLPIKFLFFHPKRWIKERPSIPPDIYKFSTPSDSLGAIYQITMNIDKGGCLKYQETTCERRTIFFPKPVFVIYIYTLSCVFARMQSLKALGFQQKKSCHRWFFGGQRPQGSILNCAPNKHILVPQERLNQLGQQLETLKLQTVEKLVWELGEFQVRISWWWENRYRWFFFGGVKRYSKLRYFQSWFRFFLREIQWFTPKKALALEFSKANFHPPPCVLKGSAGW